MLIQDLINPKTHESVAQVTRNNAGEILDVKVHAYMLVQSLKFNGMLIPQKERTDDKQTHLYLNDQSKNPPYFAKLFVEYFYDNMLAKVGFYWKEAQTLDETPLHQQFGTLKI
ncbi:hypothetical protein [Rhabdochlamydiaceae symbiont of Dictyostelium giganteum]|uniref:hypothetical protein n=1 Tax=Rhabdochlamydiaceae symbiont of Dictyostelium giganteum TaxID=3342349 RepID=UPI00384DE7E5